MANMDALLKIRADVQGANGIVSLGRNLKGVEQAAAGAGVAMKGLAGSSALLQSSFGALLPLLSAAGLVGMVKSSLEAGDAMNDLSQRTGVSVEALAKFKKAAATSGTDIDGVAKSLGKLSKGLLEVATTGKGKTAEALRALGVSATDASGKIKGADQVTLEIADRFKAMPDGVVKTALALQLFGKAGAEMIPLLNMGGKAIDDLKVKMTTAFAQKADEYSDKLAVLSGKVGAFGADLLIALLPALNAVTDAVTAGVTAFNAMPDGLKGTTLAVAGLAIAWGPLTGAVAAGTRTVAFAANALELMRYQAALAGGVLPLLAGGLDAVKIAILGIPGWGWALAGVTALAALLTWTYKTNDGFKTFVDNLAGVVANDFKAAMNQMGELANNTGTVIRNGWSDLVGYASKIGAGIANAFAGPFGFIGDIAQKTMAFVTEKINGMVNAIPKPIRDKIGVAVQNAAAVALPGLGVTLYAINAMQRAGAMGSKPQAAPAAAAASTFSGGTFTPDLSGMGADGKKPKEKNFQLSSQGKALVAAANKLGVSPLDLAQIMSFETGGTFSPSIWGGTNNQYMGLIQFGGPERRQYGANPRQTFEEQVQGPVVGFLQDRAKVRGLSTQGMTAAEMYRLVNPGYGDNAFNRASGARGDRNIALQRFFGGKAENLQYDAAAAGADAAQGFEAARKEAEQTAKQLQAARDLVQTKEAGFELANAISPLEKLSLEFDNERTNRMQEYVDKLRNARSEEERLLLVQGQAFDIRKSEITYQEKLQTITSEQLDLERERVKLLGESMAYMEELSSRNSIGAGAQQGLQSYVDSVGNLRDAMAQLTTNAIGGLENSLTDLATTGAGNFREFAASILRDTTRMIIRQLVLKSIMQLIGGIGGSTAGRGFEVPGAGFMPTNGSYAFTPNAMGNAFARNGIQPFAMGGIVNKPTLFQFASGGSFRNGLMGEAGPEAVMPLRRGPDGRLGVAAAGGSGGTTNVTINVDASGTSAQGDQGSASALARDLAQVVDERLIYQRRPGGLLAR